MTGSHPRRKYKYPPGQAALGKDIVATLLIGLNANNRVCGMGMNGASNSAFKRYWPLPNNWPFKWFIPKADVGEERNKFAILKYRGCIWQRADKIRPALFWTRFPVSATSLVREKIL